MNKIKKTVLLLITACFFILCGCSSNKASETDVPVLIPAQGLNSDYSADQQYQILTPLSSAVNFGHGITLDSGDSFYITSDAPDNRVYKVSVSTGNTMAYFGGTGTGDGQFNTPFDIAWFNDLNLFVTDKNNNRVVKFNSSGLFLSSFNALDSGTLLSGPKGCAVTKSGYLFVVDSLNNRVVKFDINGNFKLQIGSGFGTGDYQMNAPTGIEVDNSGNLFIADTGNNRILKYTEEGVFVKKIGSYGISPGQIISPLDITITPSKRLFVTDSANHRLSCFNLDGGFIQITGSFGTGLSSLNIPRGIASDLSSRLYVIDEGNLKIKRFVQQP